MDYGCLDKASSEESRDGEVKRICADCGTSKTPLWRGGPAGPKSLCNACGIRSRKKRRAILGLQKGQVVVDERKSKKISNNINGSNSKLDGTLHKRLMGLGKDVLMRRSRMEKKKLGEEEQAALLLMALSYGSVYA